MLLNFKPNRKYLFLFILKDLVKSTELGRCEVLLFVFKLVKNLYIFEKNYAESDFICTNDKTRLM